MLDEDAKWFKVSLRFEGDGFDPIKLEELLGLAPDVLGIKGCARLGKNGRQYAPYETNIWSHRMEISSEVGFDEQIRKLFVKLGDRVEKVRFLCMTEGVDGEVFCGFSSGNGQGGDAISPTTLKLLADNGLWLGLDLYPPDIDEGDKSEAAMDTDAGNTED